MKTSNDTDNHLQRMSLSIFLLTLIVFAGIATAQAPDAGKHAVPSKEDRDKVLTEVRSIFPFDDAKTASEKKTLAAKLLSTGRETNDDVVAKFVLLNLSQKMYGSAGDLRGAINAIDVMAIDFEFDADVVRVSALRNAAANPAITDRQKTEIIDTAKEMTRDFIAADEYEKAAGLSAVMLGYAARWRDGSVLKEFTKSETAARRMAAEFKAVLAALQTLEADPTNAQASDVVGRFLALKKGDWQRGLPYLTSSANESVREAAKFEMEGVEGGDAMLKAADNWWECAITTSNSSEKKNLFARSLAWYSKAKTEVNGLGLVKATKRIQELESMEIRAAELGNVDGEQGRKDTGDGEMLDFGETPDGSKLAEVSHTSELISMLNIRGDVVKGKWQLDDGQLQSGSDRYSRVKLLSDVPEQYELELEFQPSERGNKELVLTLPGQQGKRFTIMFNAYENGVHTGIDTIAHKRLFENPTHFAGDLFVRGQRNTVKIRVWKTGIIAWANGKKLFDWQGDFGLLNPSDSWDEPRQKALVLGTNRSDFIFYRATFVPRPEIVITHAKFGGGSNWVDVTERIREVYASHGGGVWATPGGLQSRDPTPGWKKQTQIHYTRDGQPMSRTMWEGYYNVHDLLLKN